MLKILQARLQQYMNCELPDVQAGLEKAEEPEVKLPTSTGSWKKQESSIKTSISALLTMPKPLTVWLTINCGKFCMKTAITHPHFPTGTAKSDSEFCFILLKTCPKTCRNLFLLVATCRTAEDCIICDAVFFLCVNFVSETKTKGLLKFKKIKNL